MKSEEQEKEKVKGRKKRKRKKEIKRAGEHELRIRYPIDFCGSNITYCALHNRLEKKR